MRGDKALNLLKKKKKTKQPCNFYLRFSLTFTPSMTSGPFAWCHSMKTILVIKDALQKHIFWNQSVTFSTFSRDKDSYDFLSKNTTINPPIRILKKNCSHGTSKKGCVIRQTWRTEPLDDEGVDGFTIHLARRVNSWAIYELLSYNFLLTHLLKPNHNVYCIDHPNQKALF